MSDISREFISNCTVKIKHETEKFPTTSAKMVTTDKCINVIVMNDVKVN
jgi:hypothetical protein